MSLTENIDKALTDRPYQFFPSVESTNDLAMVWLNEGTRAGSVIVADEQTRGRGRLGRTWYAPPGTALMMTYILRPAIEDLPYVGMMGALAVCEALRSLGVERCGIKWPNDVQIDGRKVCGVLPEAAWQNNRLLGVILGVGINIRVDFTGTALETTAISLDTVIPGIDRAELLRRLAARMDFWSQRLSSDDLFERWRGALVMLQRRVSINHVTGTVEGVAESVDRQGALLVRDATGMLRHVIAGDIALG
ncbi:MAG: biotin--[acetyl-CoA-carboxylase] ligase [Anaerolinea sp.]|nr:biotin--[acetyl-CoA-carboxylase] ligase [Anaerolinea sp.]